jgi:hypothetical protein
MRGPIPKRTETRRRRNDTGVEAVTVDDGPISEAPPLRDGLHPLAVAWYNALAESGQARYYEPSDWMQAQVLAEAVAEFAENPSKAAMLNAILSGSTSLLVTEGDRRRLRLELTRTGPDPDEEAAVLAIADYQQRLGS